MSPKSKLHSALFCAGLSLALLTGCTTARLALATEPDPTANFTRYKSFIMVQPTVLAPDWNLSITPELVSQMREDAAAAFTARGLRKSPDGYADVLVRVHGGLDSHTEGSLFVDVVDAKSRELIWRGSVMAEASEMPEPEKLKEAIQSIVGRYPN